MPDLVEQQKPLIKEKSEVCRSRFFSVEELHLQFSNGEERIFERFTPSGKQVVSVVAFFDKDTILLVREYGAGIEDYYISLPKGLTDPGEDVAAAANRELQEEVGFAANELIVMDKTLRASPGYSSSFAKIVIARGLYSSKLKGDEPEPLELIKWPVNKIPELILREDFVETQSITALLMVQEWLRNESGSQ